MAKRMSKSEQEKAIKSLFALFDKNQDGAVSSKELRMGLSMHGKNPTKAEIKELKREMGVQKGQKITFEQFTKCVEKYYETEELSKEAEEKRLLDAFKVFDRNNNGTIEIKELKTVLTSIGDKLKDAEVAAMFKQADTNRDGKIEYKEFIRMFTQDIN